MPFKRIAIACLLAACTVVAVAAQEPGDLSYQKTLVGPQELIHRTAVLEFPAPTPGQTAQQAEVAAVNDWLLRHGYLTAADLQGSGPQMTISGGSITITFHVPGGPDVVIVLPNGPFLPLPTDTSYLNRLMNVVVVRSISNGF